MSARPGIRWSRECGHGAGLVWVRQTISKRNGAIQIMVGRPRKSGRRQPNGQLARGYVNPKAQVCAQPHRVVVMAKYRDRPEAESNFGCQSARKFDPVSASNFDPFARRDLRVALDSSELAGIAETRRARAA